jgi:hypothetical protein
VKGTTQVQPRNLKPLRTLREENLFEKYIVVSMDNRPRQIDGIQIYSWRQFLTMLWNNEI